MLILLSLPAIGIVCTLVIDHFYDLHRVQTMCSLPGVSADPRMVRVCDEFGPILLLRDASWIAFFASLAVPAVYFVIATLVGNNRFLVAVVFDLLVKLSIAITVALVLVDAAIVVASLYYAFVLTISRIPVGLLAGIAIGGIIAAVSLIMSTFSLGRRLSLNVVGKRLSVADHGKLIGVIESIATKLGARPPDHVVVGLDPTFFVTSANVFVVGEGAKLSGATLFLSAPLVRVLNSREVIAVLAHELGHFVGRDTFYTMRFAPIYEQLQRSLSHLSSVTDASDLAKLPGLALLGILMSIFSRTERAIGRTRELEADKVAATLTGGEALVSALIKVGLAVEMWSEIRKANIDALNSGRVADNLCDAFEHFVVESLPSESGALSRLIAASESQKISHPTDTHPTTSERATSLGIDLDSVADQAVADLRNIAASPPASRVLSEDMEKELTMLEHHLVIQLGLASPPKDNETVDHSGTS